MHVTRRGGPIGFGSRSSKLTEFKSELVASPQAMCAFTVTRHVAQKARLTVAMTTYWAVHQTVDLWVTLQAPAASDPAGQGQSRANSHSPPSKAFRVMPFISMTSVVLLASTFGGVADDGLSNRERLNAYAASFLASRDSFDQINCEYELRSLSVESEAQALSGAGTPTEITQGCLIRSGRKVRCETNISEAELSGIKRTGRSTFSPDRILLGGDLGITFSPALSGGVIYSQKAAPGRLPLTPFDFGRFTGAKRQFHPGWIVERTDLDIDAKIIADPDLSPVLQEFVSARGLVPVEYTLQTPDNLVRFVYYLDPVIGCLPRVSDFYLNDRLEQRAVVTDFREFGQGRAFPIRSVNYSVASDDHGDIRVGWAIENRVTKINVDEPIDDDLFRIDIDKTSIYRDAADSDSQFNLENMQSLSLNDIPMLLERARQQSLQEKRIASERAKSTSKTVSRPGTGAWILLLVNALVLIALAVVYVRRRALR